MTRVYLVTAGQTNWDTEERIQGNLSVPLNAHGVVQMARLAAEKSDVAVQAIFSGQSQDTVQTADILAKAWGGKVRRTEALNEVDLGFWQGLPQADVAKRFGAVYKRWLRAPLSVEPPDGETLDAAYRRVATEMRRICQRHRDGSVGVVCGPLAAALVKCYLKDLDIAESLSLCGAPGRCEIIDCR